MLRDLALKTGYLQKWSRQTHGSKEANVKPKFAGGNNKVASERRTSRKKRGQNVVCTVFDSTEIIVCQIVASVLAYSARAVMNIFENYVFVLCCTAI